MGGREKIARLGSAMKTEPQPQLFRHDQPLTAIAPSDPSLTLLAKDNSYTLLLAEGARQDSCSGALFLETASLIRLAGEWSCRELPEVALVQRDDLWLAEDTRNGETIAANRGDSFRVVFISREDYERLQTFKDERAVERIFEFARRFFKVALHNRHKVLAHVSGKMRKRFIRLSGGTG